VISSGGFGYHREGFSKRPLLVCLGQSVSTKVTVWSVGSHDVFGAQTQFHGKAFLLPRKCSGRVFHFSSYMWN